MAAPKVAGIPSGGFGAPQAQRAPFPSGRRRLDLFRSRGSVSVPLEHRLPRGLGHGLALAFFVAIALFSLIAGNHFGAFRENYGEPRHALARLFGFGISKITISGIAELNEAEILAGAGITPKVSLLFLDAAEARQRLESMPLVSEASVRKLYPDELTITLVERKPAALWQRNGEVFVVAADGTVIDQMRDDRFLRLPLVVGENANVRLKDYAALIEAAGPLRSRVRAGVLRAGGHWDLKLDNGVELRLPDEGAGEALRRFALIERETRVSERDVIAIDMRMPDRLVLRLTEEASAARAEADKKKPKAKGADI